MKNKLLLIGWDAADWKIIGPLIAKGQMPALKSLIDRGVYGNMSTMNPPFSPMLWSTVATGKTPDKHGVLGFLELVPDKQAVRPVTAHSRNTRTIWNIFHNQGLTSNVVSWWPSFPAEPINGVMVSDRFQKVKKPGQKSNLQDQKAIHPVNLLETFQKLRMIPEDVTQSHILPFFPKASEIDQEKDRGLITFSKILSENVTSHNCATYLMRETQWDFMTVYYDLIDHFCHAYMKYHPPRLKQVPKKYFDIYKDGVVGAYRFQDMMLERKLELIDEDTTVIVLSDHGYESGKRRILKMPKYPSAPALEHRQFGIFVAAGPNIKRNQKVFGLGLVDIVPTLLHHFNLPIGKDMDGKVAMEIFRNTTEPKFIESWDKVKGDFGELDKSKSIDQISDQETMDQLVELGYIDRPDENKEKAIRKVKFDLRHNLARVYLGKKDFESAKEILLDLVQEDNDIDKVPFYMDLLNISLYQRQYDLAENYISELKTMDSQFKLNTRIPEAKILAAKGKYSKALGLLKDIAESHPNSIVWFQMGKIYFKMNKFEDARTAFENSLELESDNAKVHQALAETYLELGEYETAAEHALTSIELVKYYPSAHYTLGKALEELGDKDSAAKAYKTAKNLRPQSFARAEFALERLDPQMNKSAFETPDLANREEIIIVSGLPRSGTSLMMQMLHKGGLDVLADDKRGPDESNPKGYYEYEPIKKLQRDNSCLGSAVDKAVKIVAPLLPYINPSYKYKVIFMKRDLGEIIKSQQKMIGKNPDVLPMKLFQAFERQLELVKAFYKREPGVEMIYIDYPSLIKSPDSYLIKIQDFLDRHLNISKMKKCIDSSLYRNVSSH